MLSFGAIGGFNARLRTFTHMVCISIPWVRKNTMVVLGEQSAQFRLVEFSTFHFISQSTFFKFTYLPQHAFVLVTAVYVTDLPPLVNWVHSILTALTVLTVLQNCCLPFVHNRLYLLALALSILCVLVNIMSVQSYSTALICVCPQCTLIFFYLAFMSLNSCYMARHLVFSIVRLFVTIMWA